MKNYKRILSLLLSVVLFVLLIPATQADAATTQEKVKEKISWVIASIPDDCDTDYEKAKYLHDYLCETVTYKEGESDYAYTALLNGIADCGGYADAYKELLLAVGILCDTVHGVASTGPHAWNMIWLDGKCYFTDVTWDDARFDIIYDYFMISYEKMEKDHTAYSVQGGVLRLPNTCKHTDRQYTYVDTGKPGSGHFNNATTPEEAARHFKVSKVDGSQVYFSCEFQFDGNSEAWVRANEFQIGKKLGESVFSRVLGYGDGHGYLEYESSDYPFTPTQAIAFAQPTVTLNNSKMRKQLAVNFTPADASFQDVKYSSSDPRIAKVDEKGMVRAVSSGTATITATAADGKTATCQVVVNHTHKAIRAVSASKATCLKKGYTAHYICDSCGTRFTDSKGKHPVSLMDVVLPNIFHGPWHNESNRKGHWPACVCGYHNDYVQPHYDENDDGKCDDSDCAYVMNSTTTKPATKPTQPATKPVQPSTKPTVPTTTSPATVTTTPTTTESTSVPTTSAPSADTIPSATMNPVENSSVAPSQPTETTDENGIIPWIAIGAIVITAGIAVIVGIRKRNRMRQE